MKSREEYRASIFSKRDAVLKKRKKSIAQAVAGTAAVVLLTASAAAIPSFTKNLPRENETTTLSAASAVHKNKTDSFTDSYGNLEENENKVTTRADTPIYNNEAVAETVPETATAIVTQIVHYPVTKKHPNFKPEGVDSAEELTEAAQSNNDSIGSLIMNFINRVTEQPPAPETGGDDVEDFAVAPDSADGSAEYTQDEIISAATNYLPDNAKEHANPDKAFVTVTRTSQGEEYYEVRFDINGAKYKVTLNAENLDMIAVESTDTSGSASTPPQSQISPPYIPGQ